MSYIDVTGKTEDEAIARALAQLNLDRDDVSVEILERAKAGFLGLGSAPAKVRVTYGAEEEPAARPAPAEVPVSAAPAAPAAPAAVSAPPAEPRAAAPAESGRAPAARPEKPRRDKRPAEPRTAAPAGGTEEAGKPDETFVPEVLPENEADDEKTQEIKTFLSGLLAQMEVPAEIRVYLPEKGRYKVLLVGPNLGALIGRRGETLDAIQQLTSYSVNRSGAGRVRVQLDAENYRARREQSLEHLAQKVAAKVVKYRRSVTLEPMNAYERHVIHTALQETPFVTTYSSGTEPNRRVIVAYDREKK